MSSIRRANHTNFASIALEDIQKLIDILNSEFDILLDESVCDFVHPSMGYLGVEGVVKFLVSSLKNKE